MASLLESLTQRVGGDTVRQLSQQLGTDDATTYSAVSAALPVLVGALARNASSPDGANALNSALDRDHDGGVLDNLRGAIPGLAAGAGGAAILKHVLGGRQRTVEAGIGQASGINAGQAGQLLAMLAPIVMGALGRAKRSNGLDAGGLASMLGEERARLGGGEGGSGVGSLLRMLDADGDGSVVDDLGGMVGKIFNR